MLKNQKKPLSDTELEQFILIRLKRRDSLNQITTQVCEMLDCDWYAGERLVKKVQDKYKNELDHQASRLSIPVSIMSVVSGISIIFFVSLWLKQFAILCDVIQAGETISVMTAISLVYAFASPQTPHMFYLVAMLGLTGLGMILGGFAGIIQAIWQLWRLRN